jgi:hypothetical protein
MAAIEDEGAVGRRARTSSGQWPPPQIVGTQAQVADQLEASITRVEIVDFVVPVLRHRGLFRRAYRGTTGRGHRRQDA